MDAAIDAIVEAVESNAAAATRGRRRGPPPPTGEDLRTAIEAMMYATDDSDAEAHAARDAGNLSRGVDRESRLRHGRALSGDGLGLLAGCEWVESLGGVEDPGKEAQVAGAGGGVNRLREHEPE